MQNLKAKPLWTLVLLIFLTGCSGFRPAGYEVDPTGTILVVDQNGKPVEEEDLLGKKAKVWTITHEYYQGKITDTTQDTVTLEISFDPSVLEVVEKHSLILNKADITQMELEWVNEGGVVIVLTLTIITAIFFKYIVFFLAVLFGGAPGMN